MVGPRNVADPTLLWLATRQREDGSWSAADAPPCAPTDDVCATALVLHAFLSQAYTNRSEGWEGRAVADGLRWLRNQQGVDGRFGAACALRQDALATSALLSVYGRTGSTIWPAAAQRGLDSLAASRACWIPDDFPASDDALETLAWAVHAFSTAEAIVRFEKRDLRPPTLHPDPAVLAEARKRLASMREEAAVTTPTATAVRAHLTRALGNGAVDLGLLVGDLSTLADSPALQDDPERDLPARAVAFATMAFQVRGLGSTYDRWAERAWGWIASARRDSHAGDMAGSFAPRGAQSAWTGTVEATAYGLLADPPYCSAYLPAFPGTAEEGHSAK